MNNPLSNDFAAASQAVLRFLHERMGFDLWMVTRTEGDDWIVLRAEDHGYGVESNTVFRWTDSFCSRMVKGQGPRIAPKSTTIPAYADAPIGRQVKIGAYVGVPLTREDGSLFGTLCAIDPAPQPESIAEEQPLIELLAVLLSGLLNAELKAAHGARRAERSQIQAETDLLTGLYNRRGWKRLLEAEERRCRTLGHAACILAIDLDDLKKVNDSRGHAAGDELLRRTGEVIKSAVRTVDVVSRVGGDEFVVLGIECDNASAQRLIQRLRAAFEQAQVAASVGIAMRIPAMGLQGAWNAADEAMYRDKADRKASHAPPAV